MNTLMLRIAALLAVLSTALFTGPCPLHAAEKYSELMNRAGMQRMLSQQIAKAYLYNGQDILKNETGLQIKMSIARFESNDAALKKVEDSTVQEQLSSVDAVFSQLKKLVTQPYKKENGAQVLELSETLLKHSQDVVTRLEELSGTNIDNIINISGRQRMLSQRIAKYYIAYQAGFQDEDVAHQLETAVSEFAAALKSLQAEKRNSEQIKLLLTKMQKRWKIVEPYFLKFRNKGNPLITFTTTDDITTLADEVTALYVEVAAAK